MTLPLFNYTATVVRVIDGDTIDFRVDLGFHCDILIRTRLLGINAPEMNTQAGKDARAFVVAELPLGAEVHIETFKDAGDKYGRWLARVYLNSVDTLNDVMVATGHAVVMA